VKQKNKGCENMNADMWENSQITGIGVSKEERQENI
jgi:hypothetical protein